MTRLVFIQIGSEPIHIYLSIRASRKELYIHTPYIFIYVLEYVCTNNQIRNRISLCNPKPAYVRGMAGCKREPKHTYFQPSTHPSWAIRLKERRGVPDSVYERQQDKAPGDLRMCSQCRITTINSINSVHTGYLLPQAHKRADHKASVEQAWRQQRTATERFIPRGTV